MTEKGGMDLHSDLVKSRDSEDDRLKLSRERNRIHAKKTRERKKTQVGIMLRRIEELKAEKSTLLTNVIDTSVAAILITLSSNSPRLDSVVDNFNETWDFKTNSTGSETTDQDSPESIESNEDDTDVECFSSNLRSGAETDDVDALRRERNRIHAKKTRLRKKKMLIKMELALRTLEGEVKELKQRQGINLNMNCESKAIIGPCKDVENRTSASLTSLSGPSALTHSRRQTKKRKQPENTSATTGYRCFNRRNHPFNQRAHLFTSHYEQQLQMQQQSPMDASLPCPSSRTPIDSPLPPESPPSTVYHQNFHSYPAHGSHFTNTFFQQNALQLPPLYTTSQIPFSSWFPPASAVGAGQLLRTASVIEGNQVPLLSVQLTGAEA